MGRLIKLSCAVVMTPEYRRDFQMMISFETLAGAVGSGVDGTGVRRKRLGVPIPRDAAVARARSSSL